MAVNNNINAVPMPVRNEGVNDRSDVPTMPIEGLNIMYGAKGVDATYANFGGVSGHEVYDPAMAQIAANTRIPDTPNQPTHIMAFASDIQAQHADFTFTRGHRFGAPPVRIPAPQPVHANVHVQAPQANVANPPTTTRSGEPVVNTEALTNITRSTK